MHSIVFAMSFPLLSLLLETWKLYLPGDISSSEGGTYCRIPVDEQLPLIFGNYLTGCVYSEVDTSIRTLSE